MATIKDIARECGVSIATVSNVLNGKNKASRETEERVYEAVRKFGYKPNSVAKGLRSRKTGIIGIIAEDVSHFTVPYIIEALMHKLEESGYKTVLINLRLYSRWSDTWFDDEEMIRPVVNQAFEELNSIMADGVIYVAVHARKTRLFPEDLKIPAIMTYAYEEHPAALSLVVDDETSAYEAVKYLTDRGHKRIGIIGGKKDNLHTRHRLKGAERAFAEAGIPFSPDEVICVGWSRKDGYEAAQKLLEKKDLTAVFCMADRVAGGVYRYLFEKGMRVGKELSLMGFDGQDVSEYFLPQLTTMALPLEEIGFAAAQCLTQRINGEADEDASEPSVRKFPCRLIERDSVRRL